MENTSPEIPKRKSSTASIVVVVVVLLIFFSWSQTGYDHYMQEQHNRKIAENMLSAANAARTAINAYVARSGSLAGSGKDVALPPVKMNTPDHSRSASAVLEWTISIDGHIRGRNTQDVNYFDVAVEWTPSLEDRRAVWSCKVTFPERFAKLKPPPCPV